MAYKSLTHCMDSKIHGLPPAIFELIDSNSSKATQFKTRMSIENEKSPPDQKIN